MNFKKIISTALAGVMALSLSATALASGSTNTTKVTGSTETPTINVVVPTSGAVTINPYGLEVTLGDGKVKTQIVSPVNYLESTTLTALRVSATVTGEEKGTAKLATASVTGAKAPTTKSVFMFFEIGAATKNDGEGDPQWASSYDAKAANQILVSTKATTKADVVTLPASDGSDATYAAYRLNGDAVASPAAAWEATDTIDVNIAFTFLPTGSASNS